MNIKEPGWYTCKFYHAFGWRSRTLFDLFYFDLGLEFIFTLFSLLLGKIGIISRLLSPIYIELNIIIYKDFCICISSRILFWQLAGMYNAEKMVEEYESSKKKNFMIIDVEEM